MSDARIDLEALRKVLAKYVLVLRGSLIPGCRILAPQNHSRRNATLSPGSLLWLRHLFFARILRAWLRGGQIAMATAELPSQHRQKQSMRAKPTIVGPARKRVCGTQATAPRAPLFVGSSALRALLAQLELEHLYSILCLQGSRSTSPLSGFACHEGILPRHPGRCSFTTPSSMQTARAGLRIFLVSCDASVLLSILWCCQSIFLRRSSMSRPRRPFNQRSSCLS